MIKKIIACLSLLLLLVGCDAVIYSSETNTTNIVLSGSDDLTITKAGTYVLSGELNASIIINSQGDVRLVLDGVNIKADDFAAIYVKSAKSLTISLAQGSENYLEDGETYNLIDDNNVDATIFSKDDLIINGSGSLNVVGNYKDGIVSKDDLTIESGNITVTSNNHGIVGKDHLIINGGTINVTCIKDALKSNNDESEDVGIITINDGNITINADDDAITAYSCLTVNGGNIKINKSYEGLESAKIIINDGNITIISSDDGINAASKSNGYSLLRINGGNIYINAEGDGVDSNGDIQIEGGSVTVFGADNDGDGALDYDSSAIINGGEFVAIGMSGMAENFSNDSSIVSVLYNLDSTYTKGSTINILDSDGNILYTTTSVKSFNSILYASDVLKVGDTITIQINDDTYSYTIEDIVSSYGNGGMNNGPNGGQGPSNNFDPSGQDSSFNPGKGLNNGGFEPNQNSEEQVSNN